jgi:hypothetical protein
MLSFKACGSSINLFKSITSHMKSTNDFPSSSTSRCKNVSTSNFTEVTTAGRQNNQPK